MFNKKVILVAGFSRGGTNILWNILQSHPMICAPKHETGVIFDDSKYLKFGKFFARARKANLSESYIVKKITDYQLYQYKMENMLDYDNKYKFENELYKKSEISKAALCLKSVDDDIFFTDELSQIYPKLYIIFLVRNGYALASGHKRRSNSIEATANLYCRIGEKMDELSEAYYNSITLSFEDILKDPFSVSEQLYRFTSSEPIKLPKLRFKSKKVIQGKNLHKVKFGEKDQKYWFDREQTASFLDPEINKKQIEGLSASEIDIFNSIAGRQLEKFGYNIM